MAEAAVDFGTVNFRVGRAFAEAFRLCYRHIMLISVAAAIMTTLTLGLATLYLYYPDSGLPPYAVAKVLVRLVVGPLTAGMVISGIHQCLEGTPVRIGNALRHGAARYFPLLAVAALVEFIVAVGFVLLIVPGFILMAMWYVAGAACVVEQLGPFKAMKRSEVLTRGYRGQMFGIFVLVVFCVIILTAGINRGLVLVVGPYSALFLNTLLTGFAHAFGAVLAAVTFYQLRMAKEGASVVRVATVFE